MMAGSSQGPSISTFQGLDSWSFRAPSQHHLHSPSPTLTVPNSPPDSLSRISSNRSLKTKSTSGVPPLDADAIVQAAHPAHPDHRLWVERFGTAPRRKKGADGSAGAGPYKAKSLRGDPSAAATGSHSNLNGLAPGSSSFLPASPVARSAQSHNLSQSGHASSSASSSEGAPSRSASPSRRVRRRPVSHANSEQRSREDHQHLPLNAVGTPSANGSTLAERRQRSKRKKPRDRAKGKAKAPTPPLPPPRVSSSSLHQPPPGSEPSTPLTPLSPYSMQHLATGAAIDGMHASATPTQAGAKGEPTTPSELTPTAVEEKQTDAVPAEAFVFPSNGTPVSRDGEFVEEMAGPRRAPRPQNGDEHRPQHRSQWIRHPGGMSSSVKTQNESISSSCFPESTSHSRNGSSNMGQDPTAHSSSFQSALSTSQHSGSGQYAYTPSSQLPYQAQQQPRVRQSLDMRGPAYPELRFPSSSGPSLEPSRRTRSSSMDLLRESFNLTPRKASGPVREDVSASGGRGASRIRASMDAVRPRFLTPSKPSSGMSAYPDDISETSSSMANTSGFRKRLSSLKSSLRKASGNTAHADKNSSMKASSSIPSIMTSSDLSSGQTTPNRFRPRATQSMDIPRRPVPRFDDFTPPVPPLPPTLPPLAEHRILSPPTLGGTTPRARLSLVGEEAEDGSEFFDARDTDEGERSRPNKDQASNTQPQYIRASGAAAAAATGPELPTKDITEAENEVGSEKRPHSRWQHPFASAAARNSMSDSPQKATFEERWMELAAKEQASPSRASFRQQADLPPKESPLEHSNAAAHAPHGQTFEEPDEAVPQATADYPRLESVNSYGSAAGDYSGSDGMPFASVEQGLASSSTVQHISPATESATKAARSKGRLAGLWSRAARKDRGKPQASFGTERVGSPASFTSSGMIPSVSHGSVQMSEATSQHRLADDEMRETIDDSHDVSSMSMGMAGLGIQASNDPLPPTGGWRSRVSSIASVRSSRRARQASDHHKVPVPPLPPASPESQSSHGAEGGLDEAWRRNLLAEAVGLSFNHETAVAVPEGMSPQVRQGSAFSGNGLSPNGAVSNGPPVSKAKRSPFLEVVAAGRKSFSRDRIRPPSESQPDLPTIHKSLSPALLSESQKIGSDDGGSVDGDGEGESWDGMDDERETVLTVGARKAPFVRPTLDGIEERDSMSQGSPSPTSSSNGASRSLREQQSTIGSMAVRLVRPSIDGDTGSEIVTTIDSSEVPEALSAASPSPVSKSFAEKRASLGKHATPPNLQLSPSQETLEAYDAGAGDETAGRDADSAPSPSPSFGRRTPRSARFPFVGKGGGSSPSLPRTSFSTDRDRAPVASPYVPHASSPRPGALRGAFKKFTSSPISPALRSFSGSKGIGKGISSDSFRGVDDHGDYDEVLADPPPGQMPWDDSLAAAQAATRLLQAHTETLLPSPAGTSLTATPSRTGTSSSHESGNNGSASGQRNVGLDVGPVGNSPIDRTFTSSPKSFARAVEPASPAVPGYGTPPPRPPRNRTGSSHMTSSSGGRGTPMDADASPSSVPVHHTRRATGGSSPPSGRSGPAGTAKNSGLTSPDLSAFEAMLRAQKSREEETLRSISARTGLASRPQGTAQ